MNAMRQIVRSFGRGRGLAVVVSVAMLGGGQLVAQATAAAQPVAAQPAATLYPLSQTPNFANSVLFSPYYDVPAAVTDIASVESAMTLQHYAVTKYVGYTTVENQPTSAADGMLTTGSAVATSASLFTGAANYVGYRISDTQSRIPPIVGGTRITAENNTNLPVPAAAPCNPTLPAHSVCLSANAIGANTANDVFTILTATTADDYQTLLTGGFGVIFWVTHGEPSLVSVERHTTNALCNAAVTNYQNRAVNPYPAGTVVCLGRVVWFTNNGIRTYFRDQNSIIYGGSCYSQTLYRNNFAGPGYTGAGTGNGPGDEPDYVANAAAYGADGFDMGNNNTPARDYIGNIHAVPMCNQTANVKRFFGRLSAVPAYGGNLRWATVDFAAGGWQNDAGITSRKVPPAFPPVPPAPPRFTHHGATATMNSPACATCDSDLSPAVKQVLPRAGSVLVSPAAHDGAVVFDTKMDMTVNPASVVTVQGCGATINNPAWSTTANGHNALDFSLQTTAPGTATLTVRAPFAQALSPNDSQLDGNQNPAGTNHVGPNQDDYVWTVSCTAVQVLVGYADGFHGNPQFPSPWVGSPGVVFEGCHPVASCNYEAGAVRVVNNSAASVTVNSVAVHVDTCTYTGWPSATLAPGSQLIVTQLGKVGAANGCTGPKPHHMDTSDVGPGGIGYAGNCNPDGITPTVDVTFNGAITTYRDTSRVLNTGGFDRGECPVGTNESIPWTAL